MEAACQQVKQAVEQYREVLGTVTDAELGGGLTDALKTRLNAALTAVRQASAAHNAAVDKATQDYSENVTWWNSEGVKTDSIRQSLEAQVKQLKRCYAIPRAVTDGCLEYTEDPAGEASSEPPRKRLLRTLQHGIQMKVEKERQLVELRETRMSCMPLMCLETRARVRQLNAASQALMGLPTMNFKPPLNPQGPAESLPPSIRIAHTNLHALLASAGTAATPLLSDIAADESGSLSFSAAGVRFTLCVDTPATPAPRFAGDSVGPCGLRLKVKSTWGLGTERLDFLTPGIACDAVRAACDGEGGHAFRWLEPLSGGPKWKHLDVSAAACLPGEPLNSFGQVRTYESLDFILSLLHERVAQQDSIEAGIAGFATSPHGGSGGFSLRRAAPESLPPLCVGCVLEKAGDSKVGFQKVLILYPIDAPYRPVHVSVGFEEGSGGGVPAMASAAADPLLCCAEAGAVASAEGVAVSRAVNQRLGLKSALRKGLSAPCVVPTPAEVLDMVLDVQQNPPTELDQQTKNAQLAAYTPHGLLMREWDSDLRGWRMVYKKQ